MQVLYKLVGVSSNIKTELFHPDCDEDKVSITQEDSHTFFKSHGCDVQELKLITESETMIPDKEYQVIKGSTRLIYVFTTDQELKIRLMDMFNKHGSNSIKTSQSTEIQVYPSKPDVSIVQPIPENEIKIDESVIEKSNIETLKLFNNSNFKKLFKIYIEEPYMFKHFASYISSGDVISSAISKSEDQDFTSQFNEIKKLDTIGYFKDKDALIQKTLQKFNGHINLTLRFLLATGCLLEKE